jgi:hypothetical protein
VVGRAQTAQRLRGRCLAVGVGACLAACTFTPLGAGEASATPRCHTSDLAVSLTSWGVALGNQSVEVAFNNGSGHSCYVYGYAGFGLEDAKHRVQRSLVTWGSTYFQRDRGRHRIVLRPGQRAFSNLAWGANAGPGENPYRCAPASVWLAVTPPDERTFRRVRFGRAGTRICEHGHLRATALAGTAKAPPPT